MASRSKAAILAPRKLERGERIPPEMLDELADWMRWLYPASHIAELTEDLVAVLGLTDHQVDELLDLVDRDWHNSIDHLHFRPRRAKRIIACHPVQLHR